MNPPFAMFPFYRRSVTEWLQTNEFLVNGLPGSVHRLQTRDLVRKQRVSGELDVQIVQDLQCSRLILLPHVGNREQDSREGGQIMSVCSCALQVGDSLLFVAGQATEPQHPTHRRGHASNDVLAESRS